MAGSEWYPVAVGNTWTYKSNVGQVVVQVVRHEKRGSVMCARLESATVGGKTTVEHVRVQADGVYRHAASGVDISPPLLFCKLPLKAGLTWTIDSTTLGLPLKGGFETKAEDVVVPAGRFKAMVCRSDDFTIKGRKIVHAYWFAKRVGLVKQEVDFAGKKITLELTKFAPAKTGK